MFNKEIKFISDLSLNNIKSLGSFFTIEKLLNANLHPAIITYISAEIDYLIFQDRQKLLKDSVFDYSGKEISNYFNQISEEIKISKRIAFEDVKRLIIQAVSFNANYVVRPRWSLTKLIFEDGATKTFEEINLILNYVYYSSFLKKIIIEYLTRRKLANLSITEFELIINKVDRELINTQSEKIIENALYTMADFFNIGALSKTKINVGYVELFLKEKNHIDFLLRLKHATAKDSRTNFEFSELKKILFSDSPPPVDFSDNNVSILPDSSASGNPETITEVEELLEPLPNENELDQNKVSLNETAESSEVEKIILNEIKIEDEKHDIPEFNTAASIDIEDNDSMSEELDDLLKDIPDKTEENDQTLLPAEKEKELLDFFDNELKDSDQQTTEGKNNSNIQEQLLFEDEINPIANTIPAENESTIELEEISDSQSDEDLSEHEATIQDTSHLEIEPNVEADQSKVSVDIQTQNPIQEINEPINLPKKDLASFLSDKESKRIVSDIFNEDRDDFITTIEKIQECTNYDEATEILKTVFLSSRINPFSREAVVLTNAVSNYFNKN